tara:strand:- start:387 stop:1085 length:699 start_codon:yes stop_codon:yes gene_type:complete
MGKTLIFTATYNEKDNIRKLIEDLNKLNQNLDILVIDDSSPDKTWEILQNLEKKLPNLKVIIRDGKLGLDTAHKFAFSYAKNNNYENFISMDADLSHDPLEIPKIISYLDKFPFVIGSRYSHGGRCEMTGFRLLLSFIGNKTFKYFLRINCNEFTSSFRGFNLVKLEGFDFRLINSKGYSFFMETIYRINKLNYEIKEIPIIFKDRAQGKSKIPKLEIFRSIKNLIILFFEK